MGYKREKGSIIMALNESYLVTTKNLQAILNSMVSAKSPERFNNKFLEDLEFKSSNDRLYIGVFKALGLLDENGVPTSRYHQFLDQAETGKVLALGIQEAYADLFALRKDAQKLSIDEIKGKLKTLTQGQKSDRVIGWMANTFKALCDVADWSDTTQKKTTPTKELPITKEESTSIKEPLPENLHTDSAMDLNLRYDIHVHLPETTNMDVYDAIFQSLKKHLQ